MKKFVLIMLWPTVCNFTKNKLLHRYLQRLCQNCQNSFSEQVFAGSLLLDKNSRHYERYIKQTLLGEPRQSSILINDSYLQEIDLHGTSNRTTLIEELIDLTEDSAGLIFL